MLDGLSLVSVRQWLSHPISLPHYAKKLFQALPWMVVAAGAIKVLNSPYRRWAFQLSVLPMICPPFYEMFMQTPTLKRFRIFAFTARWTEFIAHSIFLGEALSALYFSGKSLKHLAFYPPKGKLAVASDLVNLVFHLYLGKRALMNIKQRIESDIYCQPYVNSFIQAVAKRRSDQARLAMRRLAGPTKEHMVNVEKDHFTLNDRIESFFQYCKENPQKYKTAFELFPRLLKEDFKEFMSHVSRHAVCDSVIQYLELRFEQPISGKDLEEMQQWVQACIQRTKTPKELLEQLFDNRYLKKINQLEAVIAELPDPAGARDLEMFIRQMRELHNQVKALKIKEHRDIAVSLYLDGRAPLEQVLDTIGLNASHYHRLNAGFPPSPKPAKERVLEVLKNKSIYCFYNLERWNIANKESTADEVFQRLDLFFGEKYEYLEKHPIPPKGPIPPISMTKRIQKIFQTATKYIRMSSLPTLCFLAEPGFTSLGLAVGMILHGTKYLKHVSQYADAATYLKTQIPFKFIPYPNQISAMNFGIGWGGIVREYVR